MRKDQLSWEEFYKKSKNKISLPKKVEAFNRLVAHTKNFFIISGYGAFTPGYLLIISKNFIPSYGLIKEGNLEELNFIIKLIKETINQELNRNSVVFEHGMCACVGGLDRAHLHIMSIPKKINQKNIRDAINLTLYNRKTGIEYIKYKNYKLKNTHDISHIYENILSNKEDSKEFKVVGKLLKINDIKNLTIKKWPLITSEHVKNGGHYVYFKSDFETSSFLTTHNFNTQFGREVVFNIELISNKIFKKNVVGLNNKKIDLNIWQWQHYKFEKDILKSMKTAKIGLTKFKDKYQNEFNKFDLEII